MSALIRLWLAPAVLVLAAAVIVVAAPAERTLGANIRYVYVHVALTWAGMLGLAVAAAMGVVVLMRPDRRLAAWLQTTGEVALVWMALGTFVSVVAAQATWGGGFLIEPRGQAVLRLLAVGVIAAVAGRWGARPRVQAALAISIAAYAAYSLGAAPLLLHPRNAIGSAGPGGIQATFASLTLIAGLLEVWTVRHLRGAASQGMTRGRSYATSE
jgi:hypothetical protein